MIKSVKIGPYIYEVIWDSELKKKYDEDNGAEMAAYSDHDQLKIVFDPTYAEDVNRASMVHEILHCCLRISGSWIDEFSEVKIRSRYGGGLDIEEFAISGLTAPLFGVIKDNPELLDYLIGKPSGDAV